ncbi:unnamed protein product, partial [marine sediment metagenome]
DLFAYLVKQDFAKGLMPLRFNLEILYFEREKRRAWERAILGKRAADDK